MMYLTFLKLSLRNIWAQKRRSLLTVIGIFIGIAAVVAFVSLGTGLEYAIEEEFEALGADKVFVSPGDGLIGGAMADDELSERDIDTIQRTRGIALVGGTFFDWADATFRGETQRVMLFGLPTDASQDMVMESNALHVEEGRNIGENDRTNVLIGARLAESLYENEVNLRSQLELRNVRFRVVGILERTGDPEYDRGVFLPLDRAQELAGEDDTVNWVVGETAAGFDPEDVAADVEENFRQDRNLREGEEDFTVWTADEIMEAFGNILRAVQLVVVGIASISLLVGGVNIANTMYSTVTNRIREIGVMKAVGATDRQVLSIFLLESAIIGMIGGLTGIAAGYALSFGAAYAVTTTAAIPITIQLSPPLIAGTLLFSLLAGMVSGVLPARRAANLEPVDALRYE